MWKFRNPDPRLSWDIVALSLHQHPRRRRYNLPYTCVRILYPSPKSLFQSSFQHNKKREKKFYTVSSLFYGLPCISNMMIKQLNKNTNTEFYIIYLYCIYPVTKTATQRHRLIEQEQLDSTIHQDLVKKNRWFIALQFCSAMIIKPLTLSFAKVITSNS